MVRAGIESGKRLSAVAALLCDTCLAPTRHALKGCGLDNMTVIIVQFRHPAEGDVPVTVRHQQPRSSEAGPSSFPGALSSDSGVDAS